MQIDKSIFKAYDIRGIYPTQLNEEGAYAIARAMATLMISENSGKDLTIAVGGDMRLSTPSIKEKVIAGLRDSGVNVVDIGLVSTPTFYFAVGYFNYDAGIQVSASHNPQEYNGLKIVRARGVAMSGVTGIQDLHTIVEADSFATLAETAGSLEVKEGVTETAVSEYLKLAGDGEIKPFKIVIDVANAMGVTDYGALFNQLPVSVEKMNFELDGTFPAHEADPIKPENRKELEAKVVSDGAHLGISADGDADRVFIIDEKGEVVPSPILYTLLAHIEHEEHPGEPLAYEIRLGKLIEEEFADTPLVQTPVGHSIIKGYMMRTNAVFGGEISGHYFYRTPWGTYEAPMLLVTKLLMWLSKQEKPLSELVAAHKKYVSSGEINTKIGSREEVEVKIEAIKSKYSDGEMVLLDGVKVNYPEYWFSLRASNTEPVMRLIVEAKTEELMAQVRDELLKIIKS